LADSAELIQSVLKAVQIMEILDRNGSMGIREIAKSLDLGKSTVHRIISALKYAGWVVENPSTGKAELSYRLFSIGSNVIKRVNTRDLFHRHMETLSKTTGETVNLGVFFEGKIFHIDKVESQSPIKVDATVGTPTTSYNTALGKIFLASKNNDEIQQLYSGYKFIRTAKNTILSIESLLQEIEKIRNQGFAFDDEEFADSLQCFAVPISNHKGQVEYALSISFPKYRYENQPEKIQELLDHLITTGHNLSRS